MMDFEVLDERNATFQEVKDILSSLEEDETSEEQKLAMEHLKRSKLLPKKKEEKLAQELRDLNMRKLKEFYITQIVNLAPKDVEELRVIVAGSKVAFKKSDLKKIFEVVSKYVG